MDILYFILGLIQFIVGFMAFVFYKQTIFYFNESDYKNINNNSKTVVVYFSRMGYSRKLAYEIANTNNYAILEIKTSELTTNTLGFWWCGRFGMHSWKMPLSDNYDLSKYENVIIVSAIWVFKICAPIREFLSKYKEELNQYINDSVSIHSYQSKYGNLKKR